MRLSEMADSEERPQPKEGSTLRITLERDPMAPSLARAAVADFTEQREISPARLNTLALLVSELVSNAVVHSDAPPATKIEVRAEHLGPDSMRIEVTDQGSGFTVVARDPERQDGGYGLFLVDSEATSWGIDRKCGNRVWFEICDPRAARSDDA
jgi:anti-sigma regulatory factor (Ser/Thr protein kinase)